MRDLNDFLTTNVEGYLFGDLQTMIDAEPKNPPHGAVGYPLVSSAFAGIELLGALWDPDPFNTWNKGAHYFRAFWEKIYQTDPSRSALGPSLYQLARHGLAHTYVTKGPIVVVKNTANMHLTRDTVSGEIWIDACALARDLMKRYGELKPLPTDALWSSMHRRLNELDVVYTKKAVDEEPKVSSMGLAPTPAIMVALPLKIASTPSGAGQPAQIPPIPPPNAVSK